MFSSNMSFSFFSFFFLNFFIAQDVDMLQLTFPHNVQLKASCVTPSSKAKVTRSQKRSPIVTSQAEVPKVKKRKEIKDSLQVSS